MGSTKKTELMIWTCFTNVEQEKYVGLFSCLKKEKKKKKKIDIQNKLLGYRSLTITTHTT